MTSAASLCYAFGKSKSGGGMAKALDIEELMVWAAAELARKRPGATGKVYRLDVSRGDAEIMGRWNWPMGIPEVSPMFTGVYPTAGNARGEPPGEDALTIEAALARLSYVSLDFDAETRAGVMHGFGFEIDAEGILRAAARKSATLVLVQGRLGKRPSLTFEPPVPRPRLAPNGKPGAWRREIWAEPTFDDHAEAESEREVPVTSLKKRDLYPPGAYGVLEWDPDPAEIVAERAAYWAWRAGLAWLAEDLKGKLTRREAAPPAAPERPWIDPEPERASVANSGLRARVRRF